MSTGSCTKATNTLSETSIQTAAASAYSRLVRNATWVSLPGI
ncbi:MAG: hypothetical protein ABSE16_19205 [Verrucomicrobiota bacterium]